MTDEQTKIIKNWHDNKLIKRDCPSCDNPQWNIIIDEFSLISNSKKTMFNFIPVVCKNCGFTKLYSLDIIQAQNQ